MGAYGIWYGILARYLIASPRLRKLGYEPEPYQRVLTFAGQPDSGCWIHRTLETVEVKLIRYRWPAFLDLRSLAPR